MSRPISLAPVDLSIMGCDRRAESRCAGDQTTALRNAALQLAEAAVLTGPRNGPGSQAHDSVRARSPTPVLYAKVRFRAESVIRARSSIPVLCARARSRAESVILCKAQSLTLPALSSHSILAVSPSISTATIATFLHICKPVYR